MDEKRCLTLSVKRSVPIDSNPPVMTSESRFDLQDSKRASSNIDWPTTETPVAAVSQAPSDISWRSTQAAKSRSLRLLVR